MRQAYLSAVKQLELRDSPIPEPGPGEVVVRVRVALTCGTDLKTYRRGHARLPFGLFGHEGAGDIVAVGEGVNHVQVGQAVTWTPTAPCKNCEMCRRERPNLCRNLMETVVLGSFADYLKINARVAAVHVLPIPPELSYLDAAFIEPLSCVLHGWRLLEPLPGPRVIILGTGTMAMLHLLEARQHGSHCLVVGRRAEPLERALTLGAQETVLVSENDWVSAVSKAQQITCGGADIVIEATGSQPVWELCPKFAAPGGKILFYSGLAKGEQVRFSAEEIHYDELTLIGTFHYITSDVYAARERLLQGLNLRPLITAERPLDDITRVFEDLDEGRGSKYALLME